METAAAVEIDKGGLRQLLVDDFHRCLKKPTQEPLRLFHSYAQARRRLIYKPIFKRQRSTLSMLFFGPKNGEHLATVHLAGWTMVCAIVGGQVTPAFDVATVKKSGSEVVSRRFTIQGRRFVTVHTSLADLIQYAYGLHPRQMAKGPKWLESDKFDVVGSTSSDREPTEQEWMKMMANLLASRFRLRFHLEKREMAVYAIVVARDGPKLKSSDGSPNGAGSVGFHGRGQLVATNSKVEDLAWELQSAVVDRPVVDRTGLTSRFNFTLTWTPDEFQKSNLAGQAPTSDVPDLFTAIQQQLGLRLEATKSPVDVMVVDHLERPSEN